MCTTSLKVALLIINKLLIMKKRNKYKIGKGKNQVNWAWKSKTINIWCDKVTSAPFNKNIQKQEARKIYFLYSDRVFPLLRFIPRWNGGFEGQPSAKLCCFHCSPPSPGRQVWKFNYKCSHSHANSLRSGLSTAFYSLASMKTSL